MYILVARIPLIKNDCHDCLTFACAVYIIKKLYIIFA